MVGSRTAAKRKLRKPQRANARTMRRIPTDAERKFWWRVRDRRLGGYKFKRQFLIGPYIADFACLERKLIVELDGGQHATQISYDNRRSDFLRAQGFHILRFWNTDVLSNLDDIVEIVLQALSAPLTLPSPPEGERGS